jgi:hypothetical protein
MTLNLRRAIGPTDKKVFLAGEGSNELGGWANKIEYRTEEPGILEILLRKVKAEGWMICGAKTWKEIKKYRAGEHRSAEERNILGICYEAQKNGYDVITFSRDSDGNRERVADIQKGIQSATLLWSDRLGIIGGCAIPCIEGWILAIAGIKDTESSSRTKIETRIIELGIHLKNTTEMVAKIEECGIDAIAADAHSLISWIETARDKLPSPAE